MPTKKRYLLEDEAFALLDMFREDMYEAPDKLSDREILMDYFADKKYIYSTDGHFACRIKISSIDFDGIRQTESKKGLKVLESLQRFFDHKDGFKEFDPSEFRVMLSKLPFYSEYNMGVILNNHVFDADKFKKLVEAIDFVCDSTCNQQEGFKYKFINPYEKLYTGQTPGFLIEYGPVRIILMSRMDKRELVKESGCPFVEIKI